MKFRRVLVACALVACGGDDGGPLPDGGGALPPLRVPQIGELRPAEAPLFGEAFALEVRGAGFDADAVVVLDGQVLVTRVVSPTELSADVPAEALAAPGVRTIAAAHAEADGGTSGELGLRVVEGIAAPLVDLVVPDRAFAGAPAFEAAVRGWNFDPTSVVRWAGAPRPTTYVNASELRFAVDAADVAATGSVPVSVVTEGVPGSAALPFTIEEAPVVAVARLTVTPAGGESTGIALDPSVSSDGRFVAFASTGNDLVAGDGAHRDVFWRDTCRGAVACTPTTRRISEAMTGGDASADSQDPVISANGRFVAFASAAVDLAPGGTPGLAEVHVHDTCAGVTGCTPTTVRAAPPTIAFNFAIFPSISGDGRFVVYTANTTSVWLADLCFGAAGCTPSVTRIDAANDGTPGDRPASSPQISANGRYVAFRSNARNFDGPQAAFTTHLYLVDTCFGATGCARSIRRLDVPPDGVTEANGAVTVNSLGISGDGRYVTFTSSATNLLATPTSGFQVFVRDTCEGAGAGCTPSTALVSTSSAGDAGDGSSMSSAPSLDGRFVAFQSSASNLVAGDVNNRRDVFVRDTCAGASGCTPTTRLVSIGHDGDPGDDDSPLSQEYAPRISADGLVTVFTSRATNLVPADTNGQVDAFICIGAP